MQKYSFNYAIAHSTVNLSNQAFYEPYDVDSENRRKLVKNLKFITILITEHHFGIITKL